MTLVPLLNAGLEAVLNRLFWQDRGLRTERQRLNGKTLQWCLAELPQPVTLVFSEQRIDVMGAWQGECDCTLHTRLSLLPALRDKQQLTGLIRRGELEVSGDIQVLQYFSALIDMAEFDLAEYLSPWTGDIIAQSASQLAQRGFHALRGEIRRKQRWLAEALTEEWRMAPGTLEVAWFCEEVAALDKQVAEQEARLAKLEAQ